MALPDAIEQKSQRSTTTSDSQQNTTQAENKQTSGDQPLNPNANIVGLNDEYETLTGSPVSNKEEIRKAFSLLRDSPEAVGIIKAIIDDIMGGDVRFEYVGREDTPGNRRIMDARQFWEDGFHLTMEDALVDYLVAGDAYIFERLIDDDDLREMATEYVDSKYDFNSEQMERLAEAKTFQQAKRHVDEDNLTLRGAQYVAASTMYEDVDEEGNVEEFVQKVGSKRRRFSPDEIVHIGNMSLDGDIYSFTPLTSTFAELQLLAEVKNYHGGVFQNSGMVNKMYKMPDETRNSQNFKQFVRQVRQYRDIENRAKDMVVTGNVEVENLNDLDEQMEFENLSKYLTNVLMIAWNMPPSRLGIDVSGESSESRTSDMAVEGYYKRIERQKRKWETILNNELFIPYFDCKIHFGSSNIKQEIRQADRDQKRLQSVAGMVYAGMMDREQAMEYMGVEKTRSIQEMSDEEFRQRMGAIAGSSGDGNMQLSDSEVEGTTAQDAENDRRSETQQENEDDGETDATADNS